MHKKTKICATIGPSSESPATLKSMVKAGVNIARLNFSHGTYESHAEIIKRIRKIEQLTGEPVAIMQDLQGPKIRIGVVPDEGIKISEGGTVVLNTDVNGMKKGDIPVDYPNLHEYIKIGERILVDDGHIELKVTGLEGTRMICAVVEGQLILQHKGINLPDSKLNIDALASLSEFSYESVCEMQTLGPFGQGNPEPLFATKGVHLCSPPRRVGTTGDHLQFAVTDNTNSIRCIGFRMGPLEKKLLERDSFDIAYHAAIDSFNGNHSVQLVIEDIRFE